MRISDTYLHGDTDSIRLCVVFVVFVAVAAVPHAGVCPVVNGTDGVLCVDPPPCEVDRECSLFHKCCFNGCSKLCTIPERTDENKAGLCKGDVPVDGGWGRSPMSNCSSACSNDKHCAGDENCCWIEECGAYACSEPLLDTTRACIIKMVIFSLIGIAVLCIVVTLVVFIMNHPIKKNNALPLDEKATMPQQEYMMSQHKAVEAGALPPTV